MRKKPSAMRPMLAALTVLLAGGCVTPTPIIANDAGCSELITDQMAAAVPGAPAPAATTGDLDADLREWMAFGVAQTGQLRKANEDKADQLGIIRRCEARDRAAVRAARPGFSLF